MVRRTTDEVFYHINSSANLSRHEPMRKGATIIVGTETSPFFALYESWARTYPIRMQDGTVHQMPAMKFLAEVKNGNITPDNLPYAAYEVANHFLLLSRELVWENIRAKEFPDAPSRQRCLWLTKTAEQAQKWVTIVGFPPNTYSILRLRTIHGHLLEADGRLLAGDSEPLPAWYEKARKYWRGEMTSDPWPEAVFEGSVVVEEIIGTR